MEKENQTKIIKNWTYNEGRALISVYENRKEEYFKMRNKKNFWEAMLTDLEAMNVLVSPTTAEQVEAKWRTLCRAYKSAKDKGTGTSATKFVYIDEMDGIFHEYPVISSPHSTTVGVETNPTPAVNSLENKKNDRITKKKTKTTLLEIKMKYYEEKIEEKKQKRLFLQQYLEKKEKAREERHKEIVKLLAQHK